MVHLGGPQPEDLRIKDTKGILIRKAVIHWQCYPLTIPIFRLTKKDEEASTCLHEISVLRVSVTCHDGRKYDCF